MLHKALKFLWIVCCVYIFWSIALNIWLKDPTFKREFIISNHSSVAITVITSSETQTFDEWVISLSWSKSLLFTDTNLSDGKKEDFLLKKDNEIIIDSKQMNFRKLTKDIPVKTPSWVLINSEGWSMEDKITLIPFYISQPIYTYKYKIEVY